MAKEAQAVRNDDVNLATQPRRRPRPRAAALDLEPIPSVVCVDDESNVLEGLAVTLHGDFDVTIALGPEDAFGAMQTFGPPTVVVTDMRMPGMDGATFLDRLQHMYPDTVRIVLTGHADIEVAARAVNEGRVFRFLTKPCPAEALRAALAAAVAHAKQAAAERNAARSLLRELREALIRAERAARFETLAAGAGHELNTFALPLRVVVAELGGNVAAGTAPDPETVRMLEQIVSRVEGQARHLLDIAQASGEVRERVDLCQVVCEAAALVRNSRRVSPDVRFVFDLPRHPVFVDFARPSLEQVLINLLYNAADALVQAGNREPTIRIDLGTLADRTVEIEIGDNGCGITAAALPRVFEPYFTTKSPSAGSGLGLTVVKRIVEAHDGSVQLTSEEGIGTTVRLRLPLALAPRA